MSETPVNTTYEAHSTEPEYIETNRAFVSSLDLEGIDYLLDLACGTGLIADLVLESRPGIAIFALDLDRKQLELTRDRFSGKGLFGANGRDQRAQGLPAFLFAEASADVIPFAQNTMDGVIMGNSIHNLPDPDRLLQEIRRVLRPGGMFAFNSAFYAGTYVPGTEKFHQAWIKEALTYVMRKDRELKSKGLAGIPRKRGTAAPAFSKKWLSPTEWKDTLVRNGLDPLGFHERLVEMTQSNYETVGAYEGLASVLLSGYPVKLACEALQATVGSALAQTGFKTVPTRWLEMTAVKPAGSPNGAGERA